jgi:hypothetical protein
MIDVTCPQCSVVYHTLETNVGKRILCTKCGYVITIVPLAVAQHPPSSPSLRSYRAKPSAGKKQRTYLFAIIVIVGVALLSSLLLRYSGTPNKQGISKKPEEPAQSQPTNNTESGEKSKLIGEASLPVPDQPNSKQPADPRPTEYNSLPTGARIEEDMGTGGHGKLTVQNGTDEDAVVQLSDVTNDQTVRWFFVKAHSSAHVSRIPQGSYRLTYTTGLNWVESEDTFSWQPSYNEFERTFDYSEQRDSEGVKYHAISVTLNSVLFGNVRTRSITREEFLRGHRHVALQQ